MDEQVIKPDVLPMMIESLPTQEETTIIQGWLQTNAENVDHLAKAEKFFVQIMVGGSKRRRNCCLTRFFSV